MIPVIVKLTEDYLASRINHLEYRYGLLQTIDSWSGESTQNAMTVLATYINEGYKRTVQQ